MAQSVSGLLDALRILPGDNIVSAMLIIAIIALCVRMFRQLEMDDEIVVFDAPAEEISAATLANFGNRAQAENTVDTGFTLGQVSARGHNNAISEIASDDAALPVEAILEFAESAFLRIRRAEIENDSASVRSLFSAIGFAAWRGASDARRSRGVRIESEALHVRDSRITAHGNAAGMLTVDIHIDYAHRVRIVQGDGTDAVTGQPTGTHGAVLMRFERAANANADIPFAVVSIQPAPYGGVITAIGSENRPPLQARAAFEEFAAAGTGLNFSAFGNDVRSMIEEVEEAIYCKNPEIARRSCTEPAYLTLLLQAQADMVAARPHGRKLLQILNLDIAQFAEMPHRYYALANIRLSAEEHNSAARTYAETWIFSRGKSQSALGRHGGWLVTRINPEDEAVI